LALLVRLFGTDKALGLVSDGTADMNARSEPDPRVASDVARFKAVRARMIALAEGLSAEDLSAQSMADCSPGKWHLAHTSWFFEAMILS